MIHDLIEFVGFKNAGFAGAEYNMKRGRRVSTYNALLKPVEKIKRNLVIRRYSVVTQVAKKGDICGHEIRFHVVSCLNE